MFSGFEKLKGALDDVIKEDQNNTPAGHSKTQDEVRSEIHGEERKVHEIQKKSGWSDKVIALWMLNVLVADFVLTNIALRSRMLSMAMMRNKESKKSS
jgi:hypothetical protein